MSVAGARSNRDIPVVILAGGLGTRLREETEFRPKPMVTIGAQPMIWHIMKIYAHHGCRRFIVCLGYKGELIREFFADDSAAPNVKDWEIILEDTGDKTMTGGRIARAGKHIEADRFMVTYGDGVANLDVDALVEQHDRAGRLATVTGVHPTSRFGDLTLDGDRVTRFAEKQYLVDVWINGGFFVFERQVLDRLTGDGCALEEEPLRKLASEGQLTVYRHEGYWQPMDTYREFTLLNGLWKEGKAPWKVE